MVGREVVPSPSLIELSLPVFSMLRSPLPFLYIHNAVSGGIKHHHGSRSRDNIFCRDGVCPPPRVSGSV